MQLKSGLLLLYGFLLAYNIAAGMEAPCDTEPDKLFATARAIVATEPEKAMEVAMTMIEEGRKIQNDSLTAKAYYLTGLANIFLGKYFISKEYFAKALETDYARQNLAFQEFCWNNLGISLDYLERHSEAISAYHRSIEISKARNDSSGIMQTFVNIGILDRRSGNPEKALSRFKSALTYFTSRNDTLNMGLSLQNIGTVKADMEEYGKALESFAKALDLYEKTGNIRNVIEVYGELSRLHFEIRNPGIALELAMKADKLNETYGNSYSKAMISELAGSILTYLKRYSEAESYLFTALNLYEEIQSPKPVESTLLLIKNLYAHSGDLARYDQFKNRYKEFRDLHDQKLRINAYNELSELYEHNEFLNKIDEQQKQLLSKSRRIVFLAVVLSFVTLLAVFSFIMYLRVKGYQKILYRKNLLRIQSPSSAAERVADSETDESRLGVLYRDLLKAMEEDKLYLNSSLSLSILARTMNTNEKYISRAINSYSNSNFITFVNTYRVNEACRILMASKRSKKITEIAKITGFGDPSTFYRHFKEVTGLTPTQFLAMKKESLLHASGVRAVNGQLIPEAV